jgi:type III secretion protein W
MADPRVSGATPLSAAALQNLQKAVQEQEILQIESDQDLEQWCDMEAFNPMAMMRRFRPLDEFKEVHHEEYLEEKERLEKEEKVAEVEKVEDAATRFQRDNEELQSKTLLILRSRISSNDSPDDVLKKVLEAYPDPALADEAFEFLLQTADPATGAIILLARERLGKRFDAEIKAGRNMGAQAREFSKQGLGSPTSLRDLYRDITANPREPVILFDELSDKFNYEKLRTVIKFLLHSLGSDLKSKGPSISRPELVRLIDETRSLQGILGIYRFFQSRMKLIQRQFASYDVTFPNRIHFETLAKQLVKFLTERFMSPEKILQASRLFGISEEAIAQIIVFSQMRDALKQISPRYFRNPKQRDELFQTFLKTLEELEGELEEEEQEELQKQIKKKKEKND